MTTQEYFHVFESIIYAAIVTQILVGWSRMIVDRGNYKFYWAHLLFTVDLFLLMISNYFAGRDLAHFDDIYNTFTFIFHVVATPSLYFVVVYLMFPSNNEGVNFQELMQERIRIVFLPLLIYLLLGITENAVSQGGLFINNWPNYPGPILVAVLIWTKNIRLYEVYTVMIFILFMVLGG